MVLLQFPSAGTCCLVLSKRRKIPKSNGTPLWSLDQYKHAVDLTFPDWGANMQSSSNQLCVSTSPEHFKKSIKCTQESLLGE